MKAQVEKYFRKLTERNLSVPERTAVYAIDDEIFYMKGSNVVFPWENLFDHLTIASLIFCTPPEPLMTIMNEVTRDISNISPEDCESQTYLHDIPATDFDDWEGIVKMLKERKGGVIKGCGVIAHGSITVEQAFINVSSILHALFIKYFTDFALNEVFVSKKDRVKFKRKRLGVFENIFKNLRALPDSTPRLMCGTFENKNEIEEAMQEAGEKIVNLGLVDSCFGNISYRKGNDIYISQTSSFLDELNGCIEIVPLDGSKQTAITASSELRVHLEIIKKTGCRVVLHAHPKFSVIMSLLCEKKNECNFDCRNECPKKRFVAGVPVISPGMLSKKNQIILPDEIRKTQSMIVFGHGVFSCGEMDFNEPFEKIVQIEKKCRDKYFKMINF